MKTYISKILYINNSSVIDNISLELNIYKNTDKNSTIVELCLIHPKNNKKSDCAKKKLVDFKIKKHFIFSLNSIIKHINNSGKIEHIKLYHSLIFKTDLENVYQIFRDYNNTAKALGTDKIWEIKKIIQYILLILVMELQFTMIYIKKQKIMIKVKLFLFINIKKILRL